MTISRISLTNFKGIAETTSIDLRPVTLLFGANSAGKSSIFQALLYAREILDRLNTDPDRTLLGGDAIDLGGFRNLVHNHDADLPIVLRFDLDLTGIDLVDYVESEDFSDSVESLSGDAKSAWVQLTVTWGAIADEPVQADYEIGINGAVAARINTNRGLAARAREYGASWNRCVVMRKSAAVGDLKRCLTKCATFCRCTIWASTTRHYDLP